MLLKMTTKNTIEKSIARGRDDEGKGVREGGGGREKSELRSLDTYKVPSRKRTDAKIVSLFVRFSPRINLISRDKICFYIKSYALT